MKVILCSALMLVSASLCAMQQDAQPEAQEQQAQAEQQVAVDAKKGVTRALLKRLSSGSLSVLTVSESDLNRIDLASEGDAHKGRLRSKSTSGLPDEDELTPIS